MKLTKILSSTLLCALLLTVFMFCLTSCDEEHVCEWGNWEVSKEATCISEGTEIRVCALDPTHTEERTIGMTEHLYGEDWFWSKGFHWNKCTVCGEHDENDEVPHTSSGAATVEKAETCTVCGYEISPKLEPEAEPIKVIFLGDSYVYFGCTVTEKTQSVLSQNSRKNDRGYFYQLCRANDIDVEVTNWTFGGHGLSSLFSTCCPTERPCKGADHLSNLVDRNYDYVVFSPTAALNTETLEYWTEFIIDLFTEANPDTKFIMLGNSGIYGYNQTNTANKALYEHYQVVEDKYGVKVANWGAIAAGLIENKYILTGAHEYERHTFAISKDSFHPGQLAGYITSLMTYCLITGESAIGQPYDFCGNGNLHPSFDFNTYTSKYYTKGSTNYVEIFNDPAEMRALQELVQEYILTRPYRNDDK